jgi:hypothetical protein
MASVGGSIESVSINGRIFAVAADADGSKKLGGAMAEQQPNGNGTSRLIKTRVNWEVSGLTLALDANQADHEFLQSVADGNVNVSISLTEASGVTWQGTGTITGDLVASTMSSTAAVVLGGPGKLTQQ